MTIDNTLKNNAFSSVANDTVAVIGAGVAGISAVATLRTLGVKYRWLATPTSPNEPPELGGMLRRVRNKIKNSPPMPAIFGSQLIEKMEFFTNDVLQTWPEPARVNHILFEQNAFTLKTDHDPIYASAVIVATGTRYRKLGVPGEPPEPTSWYRQSATDCGDEFEDRDILVVGGGDAALENALTLADLGANVELAVRNNFSARRRWVDSAKKHSKINILQIPTEVASFLPPHNNGRCVVRFATSSKADTRLVEYDCVFVRIGVTPYYPTLPADVAIDDCGFIIVGRDCRTSMAGLFAAGDVTLTNIRSVSVSLGDGAHAARSAAEYLGYFQ